MRGWARRELSVWNPASAANNPLRPPRIWCRLRFDGGQLFFINGLVLISTQAWCRRCVDRLRVPAAIAGERRRTAVGTKDNVSMRGPFNAARASPNAIEAIPMTTPWPRRDETVQGPQHVAHSEGHSSGCAVHGIRPALVLSAEAVTFRVDRILNRKVRADDGR